MSSATYTPLQVLSLTSSVYFKLQIQTALVRRSIGGVDDAVQHELGLEQQQQHDETATSKSLISGMLKVLYDRSKDGTVLKKRVVSLVKEVLDRQLEIIHDAERLEGQKCEVLLSLLGQFREGLFFDEGFSSVRIYLFLYLSPGC